MRIEVTALIILFQVVTCITAMAQKDPQVYWGPDTTKSPPTHFKDYSDVLDHVYGNLEKHLTFDVLVDRVPEISRREVFKGEHPDSLLALEDFYFIYTEMTDAQMPMTPRPAFFQLDSTARETYAKEDAVTIGLLRYKYHEISEEAKEKGGIYWDEYALKVTDKEVSYDLFRSEEVFALSPLIEGYLHEGKVSFILDSSFFFTNVYDDLPYAMAIDFGDGGGFREVRFNEPMDVYYNGEGEYQWYYAVHFESDDVREGSTSFSAREADPIFEYDCGEGGSIAEGEIMRDLPQEIVELSVPAPILNLKNDDPSLVSGSMGIYYGCGNTACELRKPYIVVSGYGPEVPGVVNQKTLVADQANKMLYTSMNGMYGADASGNEQAGENNGANILYRLRNEGYDVVTVYFDNGVDFVQNHAALVEEVIAWVNEEKANNGSKHENVICGQSMGGVSTRYALAAWEKKYMQEDSETYMHHQCRLWISWEGEMQGATIPMGLQLTSWYLTKKLPIALSIASFGLVGLIPGIALAEVLEVVALNNALNNAAAKSLMTYHHTNNKDKSTTLHRHPYFLKLQSELDSLGYPQFPRRVAIADGSSNVTRPNGLETSNGQIVNTCLNDVELYIPLKPLILSIKMKATTGEVNQDIELFRGRFKIDGINVPGFKVTVNKNYPKAEYAAPGSYERFYNGILIHANLSMNPANWKCRNTAYRVPFAPTTSVFDIQDDASVDYSYDMQANDLFFTSSGFMTSNHGYPHIANVSYKTPFHAVYASPLNTFHIQNPEIEMSEFISDEVSGSNKYIQNRHFAGHLNQPYSAVFETIDSVLIGSNVTERKSFGTVEVGPMSEVVISSSRSIIKSGFKTELGGRFIVHSENIDEISCFDFEVFNTMDKKLSSDVNNDSYTNKNGSFDNFDVYPNPTQELIHVTLPQITGVYNVRLMNLAGGEIMRLSNINSELDINLKGLPQGLYLLEAKDENEVSYNCKIVKQ